MQALDRICAEDDHYIHPSHVRDLKLSDQRLRVNLPLPLRPNEGLSLSSEEQKLIMEHRSKRRQTVEDQTNHYEELPGLQPKSDLIPSGW